jgi:Asp-tRNA(Asn)/Glu-tRNA(Gln) amidotransferase A subunit family amidase
MYAAFFVRFSSGKEWSDSMRPTRRQLIGQIAVAGAAAAMSRSSDAAATQAAATSGSATTQADDLTVADLASTDKVLGHPYSQAEEKMALPGMSGKRKLMRSFRERTVDHNIEPAIQFNPVLHGMMLPTGSSSFTLSAAALPDYSGNIESLAFASATDLSRLIHARKITSVALTAMYLNRLKSIGPKLNAVVTLTEDLALTQAKRADEELAGGKDRGPLHGLPYGAKDCFAARGYPTTWGVEIYKDRILDYDATVIAKLDEAGAVLCAKLSLGELCMGDVWFGGTTRCPWEPKEGSSGSSAGPCATVAAGCVAIAIGTETHGSIISPCLTNGTTGLRPTYGRVSRYGAMPLARSMDKIGPIARSVEDCAMILHAIHGPDGRDSTAVDAPFRWEGGGDTHALRVGYDPAAFDFDDEWHKKNPELASIQRAAFEKIKSMVGECKPLKLPGKEFGGIISMVIGSESSSSFLELLMSGDVRKLKQQASGSWPNAFRIGSEIPAADYLRAMQLRTQLMAAMRDAMKDVDLYITIPYVGSTVEYTNLTGHPSLVTRCGIFKGRPKLIEFVGQLYREDQILLLAHAFEKSSDFHKLWPDTTKLM